MASHPSASSDRNSPCLPPVWDNFHFRPLPVKLWQIRTSLPCFMISILPASYVKFNTNQWQRIIERLFFEFQLSCSLLVFSALSLSLQLLNITCSTFHIKVGGLSVSMHWKVKGWHSYINQSMSGVKRLLMTANHSIHFGHHLLCWIKAGL